MQRWRMMACATAVIVFSLGAVVSQGDDTTGQFLLISDMHFDPFYDGDLFPQLVDEPVENWAGILEKSQPPGFNPVHTDSNYTLVKTALDDAKKRIPEPDFILYPGDFLCHEWQKKYDALARHPHLENPVAYREFTAKVIRFLADQFRERYPETPVLPAIGNDDSLCGDYMTTPNGPFLKMLAAVWAVPLGPNADRAAFRRSLSEGGHYTFKLPGASNHRLVCLNTVFFSIKYNNACGSSLQSPALDQLDWLEDALAQARSANEKVWLMMHIPPGINAYSSLKNLALGRAAVTFWQPALTSRFLQIVQEYEGTIQTAFCGHTHADDYRVTRLEGSPVMLTKIAPGVSPIFGNNPGYQVYQYDRRTGALSNFQTYMTRLAPDKPTPATLGSWTFEYDFGKAYGLSAVNAATIAQLADRIATDPAVAQIYMQRYSVSGAVEVTPETLKSYRCAIPNVTPAEFHICYTGIPKPARAPEYAGRTASDE